ncbi:MAG: phosphoribosyltransferase family protein [bacterium]
MIKEDYYTVDICGIRRNLPLVRVAPKLKVALLNILEDTELIKAVAPKIASMLPKDTEVLLHPEGKAIPLVYEISAITGLPYVIPRKDKKQWMLDPIFTDVKSITTGKPQQYWLDRRIAHKLEGKKIAIVDDVISTGSTLEAMENLVSALNGTIVAKIAIFTEGDERKDVKALGHLPLFPEE